MLSLSCTQIKERWWQFPAGPCDVLVAGGWQVRGDGFGHGQAHGVAPAGHSQEGLWCVPGVHISV